MQVREQFAQIMRGPDGKVLRDRAGKVIVLEGERLIDMPAVTADAQAAVDAQKAQTAATEAANESTLDAKLDQALGANDVFLAKAAPDGAAQLAQLRLLTRETSALIRKLRRKLDSTAGT